MSFRDLNLKQSYDSDADDILENFYIPALSQSISYKRLSGFFSSTSFALAAKGIAKLILNGGHYFLVTGAKFQEQDIAAIREAYETPEGIVEKYMLEELENIESKFVEDHIRALGWMLKNGKLEIKVAIICDDDGFPLDQKNIEGQGIFHLKVGILEDKAGNVISFSGSENESASGWQANIEEFKVFRSWLEDEREYLDADMKKYSKYWLGGSRKTKVIDVPEAIKRKLIQIAPNDIMELDLDLWVKRRERRTAYAIELRDYQVEAVKNWITNNKRGIFEMATGTGKTFAALECIKRVFKDEHKVVTIISCPYIHLIDQWIDEIEKFGIYCQIITADSSSPNWLGGKRR